MPQLRPCASCPAHIRVWAHMLPSSPSSPAPPSPACSLPSKPGPLSCIGCRASADFHPATRRHIVLSCCTEGSQHCCCASLLFITAAMSHRPGRMGSDCFSFAANCRRDCISASSLLRCATTCFLMKMTALSSAAVPIVCSAHAGTIGTTALLTAVITIKGVAQRDKDDAEMLLPHGSKAEAVAGRPAGPVPADSRPGHQAGASAAQAERAHTRVAAKLFP